MRKLGPGATSAAASAPAGAAATATAPLTPALAPLTTPIIAFCVTTRHASGKQSRGRPETAPTSFTQLDNIVWSHRLVIFVLQYVAVPDEASGLSVSEIDTTRVTWTGGERTVSLNPVSYPTAPVGVPPTVTGNDGSGALQTAAVSFLSNAIGLRLSTRISGLQVAAQRRSTEFSHS